MRSSITHSLSLHVRSVRVYSVMYVCCCCCSCCSKETVFFVQFVAVVFIFRICTTENIINCIHFLQMHPIAVVVVCGVMQSKCNSENRVYNLHFQFFFLHFMLLSKLILSVSRSRFDAFAVYASANDCIEYLNARSSSPVTVLKVHKVSYHFDFSRKRKK